MRALAPALTNSSTAQSLYVIEENLAALLDTLDLVTPAEEQEFRRDFQIALTAAIEKRDRVGQFMAHLENQIALAASEVNRLKERKALYERALERIQDYVISTIQALGRDAKGNYRKLEGKTVTFSLVGSPPSVEITDEPGIPSQYKWITVKLPVTAWERMLALSHFGIGAISGEVRSREISIDKRAIAAAINAGNQVTGADLVIGKQRLKRS